MNPYLEAVRTLNSVGERYVIVGGFALVMHGGNRFTPDLNVVVDLQEAPLRKFVDALTAAGLESGINYDADHLVDEEKRDILCVDDGLRFFPFVDERLPNFKVDIFLEYPLDSDQLFSKAQEIDLGSEKTSICSVEDLRRMKEIAGRPQDQMDIESLTLLESYQKTGEIKEVLRTLRVLDEPYAENLVEFSKLTCEDRLRWLEDMLSTLGGFCFIG